jgi:hypothetical protein
VMVMLEGVHRQPDVLMPGLGKDLSDTQIATLGAYLIQHFGNPSAKVTTEQVALLRAGPATSAIVTVVRLALALGALMVISLIVVWRRRQMLKRRKE